MISVIIPVYNAEKYLSQCIDSVLSQTYQDCELILIDDGSKDNSLAVCKSYNDARVKIIHQENQGEAAARNAGLKIAQGEYIAFLDADDWWDKNFLLEMCSCLNDDVIPVCSFVRYLPDGRELAYPPMPTNSLPDLLRKQYPMSCCRSLFSKAILDENNISFTQGRITGADQEFTYEYMIVSSKEPRYVSGAKYYYRINPNSIMLKATYKHFDAIEAMLSVENFAREHCEASYFQAISQALRFYKCPYILDFAIMTVLTAGDTPSSVLSYLNEHGYVELLDQACAAPEHHNTNFMKLWRKSHVVCLWLYYIRKRIGNVLRKFHLR